MKQEDEDELSEWEFFVGEDGMWEYQWTKNGVADLRYETESNTIRSS